MTVHMRPLLGVLMTAVCLAACDSRFESPGPIDAETVAAETADSSPGFEQPDWQTLDHADFLVDDPGVETRRIPDPDSYDDRYQMLRWEDPNVDALTPNFAGRFVALVHGCGTGCKLISFIDLESGVHRRDLEISYQCGVSDEGSLEHSSRIECDVRSRLLVVPCLGSSFEREGHHYYEFKDDGLHLIRVDLWDTSWNRDAQGASEPPLVGFSSP